MKLLIKRTLKLGPHYIKKHKDKTSFMIYVNKSLDSLKSKSNYYAEYLKYSVLYLPTLQDGIMFDTSICYIFYKKVLFLLYIFLITGQA